MLTSSYPTKKDPSSGPFVQHLARALQKKGVDVTALVFANDGMFKDYRDDSGIRIIEYPYSLFLPPALHSHFGLVPTLKRSWLAKIEFPLYLVSTFWYLQKYAKSHDVIHAHWFLPSGFLAAIYHKLTGKPYIVTAWGAEFHLPKNLFVRSFLSFVYRNAHSAIAVSQYMRRISQGYFPNTIEVIPNGVNIWEFHPKKETKKRDQVVIGAVRLLVPEKRIQDLLHAVAILPPYYKNRVLVHIVGDGPERKNLEILVKKLKLDSIVTFFGYVSYKNVREYISNMDIVVNPSIQEGMATVNLEAMAMEKPVIAIRGVGNDETILHGKTGLLYQAKNILELKEALVSLIKNPKRRHAMGVAGRLVVEKEFSIDTVANEYTEKYNHAYRTINHSKTLTNYD